MNGMTESFALVKDLVDLRSGQGDALQLLNACNRWLETFVESRVRERFEGSRMLPCQLDLFDKARDRVLAVRMNCVETVRAGR